MSTLLEQVIARLRSLPRERQDEAAELVLSIVEQDVNAVQLSPEQVAEVKRRLRQPEEHVTHPEVRAFFQNLAV